MIDATSLPEPPRIRTRLTPFGPIVRMFKIAPGDFVVGSHLCARASFRPPLAGLPLFRLVVTFVLQEDITGTPTGDFRPISACPCWAYTRRLSGHAYGTPLISHVGVTTNKGRLFQRRLFMTNQSRLTWLVEHRAQIQRLIHDLYLVLDDEDLRKRLETKPADCSIFGLFVGAAFSLWRAVFLIDATRERWPDILKGARGFLGSLVHDNAITYDREKEWNNWTIGLHLNNARYRLHRMLDDKMPGIEKTAAFQKLKAQRTSGIDNENVQRHWETIYGALHEASFQFLKTRNLFSDRMFNKPPGDQ